MKSKLQKSVEEQRATEKEFTNLVNLTEVAGLNTEMGEVIDFNMMLTETSYGKLTPDMKHEIGEHVRGTTVFDFGAGDLSISKVLLSLGAEHVNAIDKQELHDPRKPIKGVTFFECYFDDFLKYNPTLKVEPNSVAFVSWPANHKLNGLLELLEKFKTIIYLGKNTGGSACGWPAFFRTMFLRPILAHVPLKRNTLIIWGKPDDKLAVKRRKLVLEERAGSSNTEFFTFKDNE